MKRIIPAIAAVIALIAASACGNTKLNEQDEATHRLDDSLRVALANADTMYSLLYDVTVGLEQITSLEHLLEAEINSENPNARADIERQMQAIQRGLIERRRRIDELERKLGASAGEKAELHARLNNLRKQIDSQAQTVRDLTGRLEQANIKIELLQDSLLELTANTDTLINAMNRTQADMEQELDRAYSDLNAVYYVIGNKDELKTHGFIEGGGFLKKTKLGNDFDMSYMTRVDRRELTSIPLDAKKANIMTGQPEKSYRLDKAANGMLTLVITDPDAFWSMRDFLVIETK